jgi:hypothetical protein
MLVGVALYLINTLIPMDPKIKTVINVVVLVLVLLFVLSSFGVIPAGYYPHLR